jgi:hypothetical protein
MLSGMLIQRTAVEKLLASIMSIINRDSGSCAPT